MTQFYALKREPKIQWDVAAVYALIFGGGLVIFALATWKFIEIVLFIKAWWGSL